jgi:DNA-binding NtrC family response regulator
MTASARILIVDDEKISLNNLAHIMKKEGYTVTAAQSGQSALQAIETETFDIVLTDLKMEKIDGMQVLKKCRQIQPNAEVIMITGYATLDSAVKAMKEGAFNYIAKPFKLDEVRSVVREAFEKIRLKQENEQLREQLETFRGKTTIITQDPYMQKVLDTARQVAPTDCTILISGESGTGKELLARYIHANSRRAERIYLAVNCGAFTEGLLANELFGHEKGAFTGANESKKGLIELASGGTLFLDEITEMPPSMQVKLLRVLQEKEVMRLGATHSTKVDVRFIAATNRNVQESVKNGSFRNDLYFRLNVVSLHLPSLVERKNDIPLLSYYFLNKHAIAMQKGVKEISPEVMEILMQYEFPGNIRELENVISRGVALAQGDRIEIEHLPEDLKLFHVKIFRKKDGKIPSLEEQELDYIKWVLQEVGGNKTLAAQTLGIDRVSLWRKLKKFGLLDE